MSSRKEEKERLRQERLERERAAAASAGRRKRIGLIVAAVLALAGVGAIVAVALGGGEDGGGGNGGGSNGDSSGTFPDVTVPARKVTDLQEAAKAAGCVLSEPKNEGAEHTDSDEVTVKYKSNPPTSGDHNPTPAGDGIFPEGAKTERLVHSLEHGRVIFQWGASAPARVRGALKAVYDEDKAIVILTRNDTRMPFQVAATAWDKLLACQTYNDRVPDALRAFREENRLKGPEFVPNREDPT